jgi:hypothetical protein
MTAREAHDKEWIFEVKALHLEPGGVLEVKSALQACARFA